MDEDEIAPGLVLRDTLLKSGPMEEDESSDLLAPSGFIFQFIWSIVTFRLIIKY
jgi:hypothetical protein